MDWAGARVSHLGEMSSQVLELGEMVCGRLRYRFADDGTMEVGAGDAFHVRAGHLADVLEDSELIEFTPSSDYQRKAEHLKRSAR